MEDHLIQLKRYIHEQLTAGFSPQEIADRLRAAHWSDADVHNGFRLAQEERRTTMEQTDHILTAHSSQDVAASSPAATTQPTVAATASPAVSAGAYTSNPFLANIQGLVMVLVQNPISALLLPLVSAGLLIATGLVFMLMGFITSLLQYSPLHIIAVLLMIAVVLGGLVVYISLNALTSALGAYSVLGKTVTTRQLLSVAWEKISAFVALSLLTLIIVGLGYVACIIVGIIVIANAALSPAAVVIVIPAFALCAIPGLILSARLSLAPLALFVEDLGPLEAMQRSMKLTKGHVFEMLGAQLCTSLLASNVGLLLGALAIAPYVARYRDLAQLQASGAPKPRAHWLNYIVTFAVPVLLAVLVVIGIITAHNRNTSFDTQYDPYSTIDLNNLRSGT